MLFRKIPILIIVLATFNVHGQHLKRVVTKYRKSKDVKEVYHVLRSNRKVKHGDYYAFYKGQLNMKQLRTTHIKNDTFLENDTFLGFKETGEFKNNMKEGEWIRFKAPVKAKNSISYNARYESGKYLNNEKIGVWETYLEDGKVIKRFDFDTNKGIEPIITIGLSYPSQARKNRIEGTVKVKVNYTNCEPTDFVIIEDIGYGCGEAAVKSLKEKRELEKKYGIVSNCDKVEDILSFRFKLAE